MDNLDNSPELARQLDFNDELGTFRNHFFIPDKNTIYLDGNSLGRLPLKTKELLAEVVTNQWGTGLIESWNKHWYEKSVQLGDKIAQIVGAAKGEVIVSDSTSVNLYKLAKTALQFKKEKKEIISDIHNFPTDLYIMQGLVKEFGPGYYLNLVGNTENELPETEQIIKQISEKTALIVLSLVSFKSSYLYNAEKITRVAHENGAIVLWDLSHAAGAVPVELNKTDADLAVGCTYKFLNGGPGSPAFLYVRKELQKKLEPPIQGWFGDGRPFNFELQFKPAQGIRKFLIGTPPVISQMAIEPGLNILLEAGIQKIRKKSICQSDYFISLAHEKLIEHGFKIGSPLNANERGSHVSLQHPEAYRICQALIHPQKTGIKIIPDFRNPNNIRFGITPLYTTFYELWKTIERLQIIVSHNEFKNHSIHRKTVT